VLADLDTLMRALAPGDVLRLETERRDIPVALAIWCEHTGNSIVRTDEVLELMNRSCVRRLVLDIRRGMP
jgi:hypothetical protein